MTSGAKAILWGGLTCGVLDITSAFVLWGMRGVSPVRLLQGIARGLIGPRSFQGGLGTAALGLGIHFLIAFTAATVYYALSRRLRFLVSHAVMAGMLYGVAVHLFMTFVVIPLSAIPKAPFSPSGFLTQLIIHMLFVGLPIALAVRRFST